MNDAIAYLHKKNNFDHTKSIECVELFFEYSLLRLEKERSSVNITTIYALKRDLDTVIKQILFGNIDFLKCIISNLIEYNHNYFDLMPYMYESFIMGIVSQKVYVDMIEYAYKLKKFFDGLFEIIGTLTKKKYPKVRK